MSNTQGWLKKEFERAKERSSSVPTQARPVVVRGSFSATRSVQATRPTSSGSKTEKG